LTVVTVFVALMFIGFILVDLSLQKIEARRAARGLTLAARTIKRREPVSRALDGWPGLPEGVYLSEGHSRLRPQGQGTFQIGPDALVG
jgi:hypothetical protein